ncbi:ATP synthase E subunit [Thiohalospira halophila DSM 15071]|uniref:V-type ATP synthase subunit E n=1 Tax=Thiohalospira halophila DSM 15071 TaxID=1123397 RepID=A0A1I1NJ83_9GAMM|nr:V-type ATP synthase subunit E family protein [Thiohalospira halophila]SFC97701.1 ATP synthase E subunit [Thiohalospira halophila DSM 15071]
MNASTVDEKSDPPTSILEAQAESLLQRLAEHRAARCAEIRQEAAAEARAIVQEAFADARRRMGEAVATERARARRQEAACRAREQSRARQRRQAVARDLLAEGWQALQTELERRWQDPGARQAWVDRLVAAACSRLPRGEWWLTHAPGWPAEEAEAARQQMEARGAGEVRIEEAPALRAGLRICVDGACLDASVGPSDRGLLARPQRLEGELLAHLERLTAEPEGTT